METGRFAAASLALGAISLWASENLFWIVPHDGWSLPEWGLTWIAYSLASATALAMVARSGMGGIGAAFLGGAVLGYLVEGAVVGTVYDEFPVQLVWTTLAWHGLITGGVVLGLGRAGARLGPGRMAAIWAALGLFGGVWALYWPAEHAVLPGAGVLAGYLVGLGVVVVGGHAVLDRIGQVPGPPLWAMAVAPAILALSWLVQGILTLNPLRLLLPVILWGIWVIMRRLGQGGAVSLGPPVPVWQHALFLIAPLLTVAIAVPGWAAFGAVEVNWFIAIATGLVSLAWLGRLGWRAFRGMKVV